MAFGLAVIESTLNLLPLMSQSTMHYALELVTLTLKRFLASGVDGSGSSVAATVGASSVRLVQVKYLSFLFSVLLKYSKAPENVYESKVDVMISTLFQSAFQISYSTYGIRSPILTLPVTISFFTSPEIRFIR